MSYQKLIHDYLAGELSGEEEEKLFDGLSRHPEWRKEMQIQRHMERAMEQDLHSVTVPPNTTGAVFASLGFKHRRRSVLSAKMSRGAMSHGAGSRGAGVLARDPSAASMRTMIFSGLAGMILLAGSTYFLLPLHDVATHVRRSPMFPGAVAQPMNGVGMGIVTGAGKQALSGTHDNERVAENGVGNSTKHSALPVRHSPITAIPKPKPARIANADSSNSNRQTWMPNEPLRYYSDIDNLYSVHYLTPRKIVGVSYHGQIFVSNDSGHAWALKQTGVSADLYGVHFYDMMHGVAVGEHGTILLTSDTGESWRPVASSTTATLSTVRFVTKDTAFICGDDGAMLRSTTGGISWKLEPTGIHANLFRMTFKNGMEGDAYGASGAHIATTDGGETWNSIK